MSSSRTRSWSRGALRTKNEVLGLGLGLSTGVLSLGLGLEPEGLEFFKTFCKKAKRAM